MIEVDHEKNNSGPWERVKHLIELCHPVDYDELSSETRKEIEYEDTRWEIEEEKEGGGSLRMENGDDNGNKDGDWRNLDRRVKNNTQTTRENKKLLSVIDERTSILMRLVFAVLLALVVGIGVGLAVQLLI